MEAFGRHREGIELRGLKVNLEKTKVMTTRKDINHTIRKMSLWVLRKRSGRRGSRGLVVSVQVLCALHSDKAGSNPPLPQVFQSLPSDMRLPTYCPEDSDSDSRGTLVDSKRSSAG